MPESHNNVSTESKWLILKQLIEAHFNLSEISTLCFELNIDYEELGEGLRKSERVIRMIQKMVELARIDDLLQKLNEERPQVVWPTNLPLAKLWELTSFGRAIIVPSLPLHYLSRNIEFSLLKTRILDDILFSTVSSGYRPQQLARPPLGIQGIGGIGKTLLTIELTQDPEVQDAFSDGIYWLTIGQDPQILNRQVELARILGDWKLGFSDTNEATTYLRRMLHGKKCLLILDDVWLAADVKPFQVIDPNSGSRLLLTTRNSTVLTALNADGIRLNEFGQNQSLLLIAHVLGVVPQYIVPNLTEKTSIHRSVL